MELKVFGFSFDANVRSASDSELAVDAPSPTQSSLLSDQPPLYIIRGPRAVPEVVHERRARLAALQFPLQQLQTVRRDAPAQRRRVAAAEWPVARGVGHFRSTTATTRTRATQVCPIAARSTSLTRSGLRLPQLLLLLAHLLLQGAQRLARSALHATTALST